MCASRHESRDNLVAFLNPITIWRRVRFYLFLVNITLNISRFAFLSAAVLFIFKNNVVRFQFLRPHSALKMSLFSHSFTDARRTRGHCQIFRYHRPERWSYRAIKTIYSLCEQILHHLIHFSVIRTSSLLFKIGPFLVWRWGNVLSPSNWFCWNLAIKCVRARARMHAYAVHYIHCSYM